MRVMHMATRLCTCCVYAPGTHGPPASVRCSLGRAHHCQPCKGCADCVSHDCSAACRWAYRATRRQHATYNVHIATGTFKRKTALTIHNNRVVISARPGMCECACECVCVRACVRLCVHATECVCFYAHACVCLGLCMCARTRVCPCVYVCLRPCLCLCRCVRVRVCPCVCA